jgi:NADH-quinone oxidoreductase subunit J
MLATVVFYLFAGLTLLSAVFIAFTNKVMNAAFALLVTLTGVAVLYVYLYAELLAVVQLMVYVGGTLVILIFGILLTKQSDFLQNVSRFRTFTTLSVAFILIGILLYAIQQSQFAITIQETIITQKNPLQQIGLGIMTQYLLPFELTAIFLTAVLIGAAVLVGKR